MIIPTTEQEVKNVFDLIVRSAKLAGSHTIFIDHEDIATEMLDKEWLTDTGDIEKDKENLKNRDSRVKLLLAKNLTALGVEDFKYAKHGIEFTLSTKVDIGLSAKQKTQSRPPLVCDSINTRTDFKTQFFAPVYFQRIVKALTARMNVMITGPHGCGKSRTIEEAAAYVGLKHCRIAIADTVDPHSLTVTKEIVNENGVPITKVIKGKVATMFVEGGVCILDEFDAATSSVSAALNHILEANTDLYITLEDGTEEHLRRHPDFIIAATANTEGHGDTTGFYPGRESGDQSSWSRFEIIEHADYDPKMEIAVISQWLHPNVIRALYNPENGIFTKIRQEIKSGDIHGYLSFRNIQAFAKSYHIFGWHEGFVGTILNHVNKDYREHVKQIIRLALGKEFVPSLNDYDKTDKETYIPLLKEQIAQRAKKDPNFVGII